MARQTILESSPKTQIRISVKKDTENWLKELAGLGEWSKLRLLHKAFPDSRAASMITMDFQLAMSTVPRLSRNILRRYGGEHDRQARHLKTRN